MAETKISDLSVGDWVMYRDREWQVCSLYKFTEEVGLWRKDSQFCEYVADIKPIPLTPEILEKNGFEENCGRWYNSEARMEFEQYKDGWCRTINCGEYGVYFIKYVHQLQHALRLAGVEKEIEV